MTDQRKNTPDKMAKTIINKNVAKTIIGYLLSMTALGYFTYWLIFSITHQDDVPKTIPIMSILLTGLMFIEFIQYGYTVANIKKQKEIQLATINKYKNETVEQLEKTIEKTSGKLQESWSFQTYWKARTLQDLYQFKSKMKNSKH